MSSFFVQLPTVVICTFLAGMTLFCIEVGFRVGRRFGIDEERASGALVVVQNSVMGLMAFLLGLSFSFTAGRFERRHDLEQREANCLGTAYLRTALVEAPAGKQIRALLPRYVKARLDTYRVRLIDQEAYLAAKARSNELQDRIWKLDTELFRLDKLDRRTDLLTQVLNDVFDAGGDVEEARRHRVPEIIFFLLFTSVWVCGLFVGYDFGRSGRRVVPAWLLFSGLTAMTIYITLDLDRPERGFIRNSHAPLLLLHESMMAGDQPPDQPK